MLRLACAVGLLALAGCAARPAPQVVFIDLDGDVLTYRGAIVVNSYARLQAVVGSRPVRALKISSGGGAVTEGIDIARWVHRHGIDVIVDGECFSSCANYIFPAGREKHIVAGGIVGWHGTIEHLLYQHKKGLRSSSAKVMASMETAAAKERALYADIGLNGYMSWFGKIHPYNAHNLYFLSKEDMEYFGLQRLHVRADYPASDLSRWNGREKRTIGLLKVDRAVTNASDPNWITHAPAE